ncbi:hypothetical protein C0J52_26499 [Blattella germanica]|nr:hypothetical protein C0J52_26499 [Blattella germanica]
MKVSAMLLLVLAVAVTLCIAHPPTKPTALRYRRSPQGHGSVKVLHDSQKGPVAKVELGGTIWKSDNGNFKLKSGVDYTQPLSHGKPQGGGFVRLEGKFRK